MFSVILRSRKNHKYTAQSWQNKEWCFPNLRLKIKFSIFKHMKIFSSRTKCFFDLKTFLKLEYVPVFHEWNSKHHSIFHIVNVADSTTTAKTTPALLVWTELNYQSIVLWWSRRRRLLLLLNGREPWYLTSFFLTL